MTDDHATGAVLDPETVYDALWDLAHAYMPHKLNGDVTLRSHIDGLDRATGEEKLDLYRWVIVRLVTELEKSDVYISAWLERACVMYIEQDNARLAEASRETSDVSSPVEEAPNSRAAQRDSALESSGDAYVQCVKSSGVFLQDAATLLLHNKGDRLSRRKYNKFKALMAMAEELQLRADAMRESMEWLVKVDVT